MRIKSKYPQLPCCKVLIIKHMLYWYSLPKHDADNMNHQNNKNMAFSKLTKGDLNSLRQPNSYLCPQACQIGQLQLTYIPFSSQKLIKGYQVITCFRCKLIFRYKEIQFLVWKKTMLLPGKKISLL